MSRRNMSLRGRAPTLAIGDLTQVFDYKRLIDTLLDQLTHYVSILTIGGDSC